MAQGWWSAACWAAFGGVVLSLSLVFIGTTRAARVPNGKDEEKRSRWLLFCSLIGYAAFVAGLFLPIVVHRAAKAAGIPGAEPSFTSLVLTYTRAPWPLQLVSGTTLVLTWAGLGWMTLRLAKKALPSRGVSRIGLWISAGVCVGQPLLATCFTTGFHWLYVVTWGGVAAASVSTTLAVFHVEWTRVRLTAAAILLAPLPLLGSILVLSLDRSSDSTVATGGLLIGAGLAFDTVIGIALMAVRAKDPFHRIEAAPSAFTSKVPCTSGRAAWIAAGLVLSPLLALAAWDAQIEQKARAQRLVSTVVGNPTVEASKRAVYRVHVRHELSGIPARGIQVESTFEGFTASTSWATATTDQTGSAVLSGLIPKGTTSATLAVHAVEGLDRARAALAIVPYKRGSRAPFIEGDNADQSERDARAAESRFTVGPGSRLAGTRVQVFPERDQLVRQVANRVYVFLSDARGRPLEAEMCLDEQCLHRFKTSTFGAAMLEVTPSNQDDTRTLTFWTAGVKLGETQLAVAATTDAFLLRPASSFVGPGGTLELEVLSSSSGSVFVNMVHEWRVVNSIAINVREGRGHASVELEPDLRGIWELQAYRLMTPRRGASQRQESSASTPALVAHCRLVVVGGTSPGEIALQERGGETALPLDFLSDARDGERAVARDLLLLSMRHGAIRRTEGESASGRRFSNLAKLSGVRIHLGGLFAALGGVMLLPGLTLVVLRRSRIGKLTTVASLLFLLVGLALFAMGRSWQTTGSEPRCDRCDGRR